MTTLSRPTSLLVSVRSAEEARAAVLGGASVIDVKEPDRGPLGRASVETWKAVRQAVPKDQQVTVALGELSDWENGDRFQGFETDGIAFFKLGLAKASPDWRERWAEVRQASPIETRWIAVAYADWRTAEAPPPVEVLEAARSTSNCHGILVDTFDKTKPSSLDLSSDWVGWIQEAKQVGLLVALAGGLDLASIVRLAPLRPDLFAVRGAACARSDRRGQVDSSLVAELVQTIRKACPSRDNSI